MKFAVHCGQLSFFATFLTASRNEPTSRKHGRIDSDIFQDAPGHPWSQKGGIAFS